MDELQEQKTNFEIEKLKEEIKEIKKPFWRKATFISSFYLPFIILSVTYFLNRNYISQSLELKNVQQQLTQIRLDTIQTKIKKDSQLIIQEETLQKLRLESINNSSKQIREDSLLLIKKQEQLMKNQSDLS